MSSRTSHKVLLIALFGFMSFMATFALVCCQVGKAHASPLSEPPDQLTVERTGLVREFSYTGGQQTWTVPSTGWYSLDVYGAQGGSVSGSYSGGAYAPGYRGGYGGYAGGKVRLVAGTVVYINVGGAGVGATAAGQSLAGGYNGGGSVTGNSGVNHICASGGGASHVALASGQLSSLSGNQNAVLLVAGGGGGGRNQANHGDAARWGFGGDGGGVSGGGAQSSYGSTAEASFTTISELAGTQDSGYAFGLGNSANGNSAGGGGWYGGWCGGAPNGYRYAGSGGGGSGHAHGDVRDHFLWTGNNSGNGLVRIYSIDEDNSGTRWLSDANPPLESTSTTASLLNLRHYFDYYKTSADASWSIYLHHGYQDASKGQDWTGLMSVSLSSEGASRTRIDSQRNLRFDGSQPASFSYKNRTWWYSTLGDSFCGDLADKGASGIPKLPYALDYASFGNATAENEAAAKVVIDYITYEVAFDANGGTGTTGSLFPMAGESATLPDSGFSRPGYLFGGWCSSPDGNGDHYQPGTTVSDLASNHSSITLYAEWHRVASDSFLPRLLDAAGTEFLDYSNGSTYPGEVYRKRNDGKAYFAYMNRPADQDWFGPVSVGSTAESVLYYRDDFESPSNYQARQIAYRGRSWWVGGQDGLQHPMTWTNCVDASLPFITENSGYEATYQALIDMVAFDLVLDANNDAGGESAQALLYGIEEGDLSCPFSLAGYSFVSWNTEADGSGKVVSSWDDAAALSSAGGNVRLYAQWQLEALPTGIGDGDSGSSVLCALPAVFAVLVGTSLLCKYPLRFRSGGRFERKS